MTKDQAKIQKLDKDAPCLLCGRAGRVESHVIPRFVIRYLRDTSATGYLRTTRIPNRREQGSPWDYLLCEECEGVFGEWERKFASQIFRPVVNEQRYMVRYEPWFALFATSLMWRVLVYLREHPEFGHPKISDWSVTDEMERVWRVCLLERRPNPGPFEQHLVVFGSVASASKPVPPNLHRVFQRICTFDVQSNGRDVFVYAVIPNFMFFGLGPFENPGEWRGTRLGFSGGMIGHRVIRTPGFVWSVIEELADKGRKGVEGISERQQRRILEACIENPDRVRKSRTVEAIKRDLRLSGGAAADHYFKKT